LLVYWAEPAALVAVLVAGRVNITRLEMLRQQIQAAAAVVVELVGRVTIMVVTAVQPVDMLKN
jgi:hypothetical protein